MLRRESALALDLAATLLAGRDTRAVDVLPRQARPADHASWSCARIDEELGLVLHELRQVGSGSIVGRGKEGGGVLLLRAVPRGLFGGWVS